MCSLSKVSCYTISPTKDIVSKYFPVEVQNEGSMQVRLDYNENNALRYVCGYVMRVMHTRLEMSINEKKRELRACLTEMNNVDTDEMCDDWMNFIDRDGLKYIINNFFVSVELVIRTHLRPGSSFLQFSEGQNC